MPGMQYLKKLFIAITVAAAACQAFAAAPKQPKSGVVNDDATVSLAVYAPKAASVTVGGDLAPTKMTRGADGIWRGHTKSLRPDYYTYFFNIDGVRTIDPANAFTERNEMYLSNYVVTDPKLRSQDVPHGTVAKVWGPDGRRMTVYTPPASTRAPTAAIRCFIFSTASAATRTHGPSWDALPIFSTT